MRSSPGADSDRRVSSFEPLQQRCDDIALAACVRLAINEQRATRRAPRVANSERRVHRASRRSVIPLGEPDGLAGHQTGLPGRQGSTGHPGPTAGGDGAPQRGVRIFEETRPARGRAEVVLAGLGGQPDRGRTPRPRTPRPSAHRARPGPGRSRRTRGPCGWRVRGSCRPDASPPSPPPAAAVSGRVSDAAEVLMPVLDTRPLCSLAVMVSRRSQSDLLNQRRGAGGRGSVVEEGALGACLETTAGSASPSGWFRDGR
jgi:hypothetical protein